MGVDVDSLHHYYRIHGLDDSVATNAAWAVGVPRFAALFESLGIPATFYCVAEDLEIPGNAARLKTLVAQGHEIGNHSWRHRYDLTRLPAAERFEELNEGRCRLEAAAGVPVTGFRAPGYNTHAELQVQIRQSGHRYDSSVFPCPPYYLAKAAVMGLMGLRGRKSRSVLGDPRVLTAPNEPYIASQRSPYRAGVGGLQQFPIAVVAGAPLIGTAFTALGAVGSRALGALAVRRRRHLTLEFHALDLLSLADDGLDPVLAIQPDLKVSVARKQRAFTAVLEAVGRRASWVRLDELAR